jgi:hypothetical protein
VGSRPSGVFRRGAYFLYRCVLNEAQVAVKMSNRTVRKRRLTQALPAVLKKGGRQVVDRNVFCLAAAWPRRGVLAYERGDGGLCGIRSFPRRMC